MNTDTPHSAILLIHCPDKKGLVASVTEFIFKNSGNISELDQHIDALESVFFMRVEWNLEHFTVPDEKIDERFREEIGERFGMHWELHFSYEKPRMAIFVSKHSHCLYDILSRCRSGEWDVEAPLVISNHPDLEETAKRFDTDYYTFPITDDNKKELERKQLDVLDEYRIDFIVLARYMQILTDDFVHRYPNRIINIHHSFLPAFPGAKPYYSAYKRGVKISGATSHYVDTGLDTGPIIEQDIVRVSHKDSVQDLIRRGRDLEKVVLSRSIWYHVRRKILVYNNRTIIFD